MNKRPNIIVLSVLFLLLCLASVSLFIKHDNSASKTPYNISKEDSELVGFLTSFLRVSLDDENKSYDGMTSKDYMKERKVFFHDKAWDDYKIFVTEQRALLEKEQGKLSRSMRIKPHYNFMIVDSDIQTIEFASFNKKNSKTYNVEFKINRCLVHYKGDPKDRMCFGQGYFVISLEMRGKAPFKDLSLIRFTTWKASLENNE